MRRSFTCVVLFYAAVMIISCSKGGKTIGFSQSSQQLIAGQWILQQQKVVQYVNSVARLDTTYNASQNNIAKIQFNKDGTFHSISLYSTGQYNGSLSASGVTTADSTAGVFSFAGTNFNVSAPIAGLGSGGFAFGTTITNNPAVFTPVSNTITVTQLTASRLSLHTENIYTLTSNQVTQTFRNVCDYYFTR